MKTFINGEVVRGNIIEKKCNVKFIKFIPYDLVKCPYIALVCIGIHNHPPPSPNRTPTGSVVHGTCPAKILMSRTCPGHVPSNVPSKKLSKITNNKIIKNFKRLYLRQY